MMALDEITGEIVDASINPEALGKGVVQSRTLPHLGGRWPLRS